MLKSFLSSIIFIFFLSFSPPVFASFDYTPMESIPGFSTDGNFCNYITTVYKFGIWTIGICAMFMIILGGYMYIMSAGNNASMTKAKGFIYDAIAGVILAFISYLILYEINPDLIQLKGICSSSSATGATPESSSSATGTTPESSSSATGTTPESSSSATGATPESSSSATGTTTTSQTNSEKEAANRATLTSNGISVNRANACSEGQTTGCTSTSGWRQETLDGVVDLKKSCPECPITVTGGSESHSSGTYSHANGYKADLQPNSTLNSYIENNYTYSGVRSDGAKQYTDSKGNTYAKESDHWDVCYNCKK